MYRSRTDVRIPVGLGVGQVIGKQGSNLKYLQTRCGARMSVDTKNETVQVSGDSTAVSLALRLLEAQFASWRSSGQPFLNCTRTASMRLLLIQFPQLPDRTVTQPVLH